MSTPEEVKKLLSSLIISSSKGLTTKRLYYDYKNEIGAEVPFHKFGFPNFESYLRSIPDICIVHGTGIMAVVEPVVNEKTKHINDMILKQKSSRKRGARPQPRRLRGVEIKKQPLLPTPNYDNVQLPTLFATKCGPPPAEYTLERYEVQKTLSKFQKPKRTRTRNNQQRECIQNYENIPSTSNTKTTQKILNDMKQCQNIINTLESNKNDNINFIPDKSVTNTEPVIVQKETLIHNNIGSEQRHDNYKQYNHRISISTNEDDRFSELNFSDNSFEDLIYQSDDDEDLHIETDLRRLKFDENAEPSTEHLHINTNINPTTNASPLPVKQRVSYRVHEKVKKNLLTLIEAHADGIWCSKLSHSYKERFREELDPFEFGFSSMSQMCEDLTDIFHMFRPGKTDWKIFDKRRPLPPKWDIKEWCENVKIFATSKRLTTNEPPIPPNSFNHKEKQKMVYPPNCVHLEDNIESQWLINDEKEMDYIEIIVSEVYDPSKFWIQLKPEADKLNTLMNELNEFYHLNCEEYKLTRSSCQPGLFIAALFLGEYHRAVILKIFSDDTLKAFYLDYGTVCEVHISKTCFLHRDFSYIPQQAIRARLSNIIPAEQNTMWPISTSLRFLDLIKDKSLVGLITYRDIENLILSIIITDVSNEEYDIHINDTLVDEDLAVIGNKADICETSSAIIPNVHLYPSFDNLEHGLCPTFFDLLKFDKLGFTTEQIFKDFFDPYKIKGNYDEIDASDSASQVEQYIDTHANSSDAIQENEVIISSNDAKLRVTTPKGKTPPSSEDSNNVREPLRESVGDESNLFRMRLQNVEPSTPIEDKSTKSVLRPPPGFEYVKPNAPNLNFPLNNTITYPYIYPTLGVDQNLFQQQLLNMYPKELQLLLMAPNQFTNHSDIQSSYALTNIQSETSIPKTTKYIFQKFVNDATIHILLVNNEYYLSTQEVISSLLKSRLLFITWLKTNGLQTDEFPSKIFNLNKNSELYEEICKFKIQGVQNIKTVGFIIRLTLLEDAMKIIEVHGNKEILASMKKISEYCQNTKSSTVLTPE